MSNSSSRYKLLDVGLTGLGFQAVAIRVAPWLPQWVSANVVTALGAVGCVSVVFSLMSPSVISGILIFTILFLDFLDGAVAKSRNAASEFGRVFDGTVDLVFWLAILIGLYMAGFRWLTLGLLVIYTIDISWRLLLGHSTSLTAHGGDRYNGPTILENIISKWKPFVYPFINYYDSLSLLSLTLVFMPQYVDFWLWYELVRRLLLLCKKLREIIYIYANEGADC